MSMESKHFGEIMPEVSITGGFFYCPLPCWFKVMEPTGDLKMLAISAAYTEMFGIQDKQYAGKLDVDVWEKDTADAFSEADRECLRTKGFVHKIETFLNPKSGKWVSLEVYKWAVTEILNGETVVFGVAGIGVRMMEVAPQSKPWSEDASTNFYKE